MRILIVWAHPEARSFNAAMVATARQTLEAAGHEVQISDLYRLGWQPVSDRHNFTTLADGDYFKPQAEEALASEQQGFAADIAAEQAKLDWCELMIWQFPLWWFGLPAILKGWVDRVFAMGKVYGFGQIYANGSQKGKKALLSLTTGGPQPAYVKGGFNGDLLGVLRPIQRGMLEFVGFEVLAPQVVYQPVRLDDADRAAELQRWAERLTTIASEPPIAVGEF